MCYFKSALSCSSSCRDFAGAAARNPASNEKGKDSVSFKKVSSKKSNFFQLYPYVVDNPRVPVSDTLPDTLFLKIIFHCFPSNLQDIRLYR